MTVLWVTQKVLEYMLVSYSTMATEQHSLIPPPIISAGHLILQSHNIIEPANKVLFVEMRLSGKGDLGTSLKKKQTPFVQHSSLTVQHNNYLSCFIDRSTIDEACWSNVLMISKSHMCIGTDRIAL